MSNDAWVEAEATRSPTEYDIVLHRSGRNPETVLYLATTRSVKDNPIPSIPLRLQQLRERFNRSYTVLEEFALRTLPFFDDYDDFAAVAKTLSLIVPDLRAGVIDELGGKFVGPSRRADLIGLESELRAFCKESTGWVMGNQRGLCAEVILVGGSDFYKGNAVRKTFLRSA